MKKIIMLLVFLATAPLANLVAHGGHGGGGGGGHEGGGHEGGGARDNNIGRDNLGRNNRVGDDYNRGRQYHDPNLYYGYGGGYYNSGEGLDYNPNSESQPGESDDTDALYDAYLRSNPKIPSPM